MVRTDAVANVAGVHHHETALPGRDGAIRDSVGQPVAEPVLSAGTGTDQGPRIAIRLQPSFPEPASISGMLLHHLPETPDSTLAEFLHCLLRGISPTEETNSIS